MADTPLPCPGVTTVYAVALLFRRRDGAPDQVLMGWPVVADGDRPLTDEQVIDVAAREAILGVENPTLYRLALTHISSVVLREKPTDV